jgi:hypothetical protein
MFIYKIHLLYYRHKPLLLQARGVQRDLLDLLEVQPAQQDPLVLMVQQVFRVFRASRELRVL